MRKDDVFFSTGAGLRMDEKNGAIVLNPKAVPLRESCCVCLVETGVLLKAVVAKKWSVKHDQDNEIVEVNHKSMKIIDGLVGVPVNEATKTVSNPCLLI